ncbi:MAG: PEP-CTERM sorting domain-containing protein [Planctomycetes bacterium]|nr:PEP-CTERM sorting domain-containing protein [Planctomycetota bacterium]
MMRPFTPPNRRGAQTERERNMRKNGFFLICAGVAVLLFVLTWTDRVGAIGGHGKSTGSTSGGNIPPPPKGSGGGTGDGGGSQGKGGDGGGSGGGGGGGQSYPEPSTLLLGLVGIGGAAVARLRRRKQHLAVA